MSRLSICIPSYNRLGMLKELVNSIPEEYEVCISDNGNSVPDNSFHRPNIIIDHLSTVVAPVVNWNNAINLTDKEWFILPGDDDVILHEKLPTIEYYMDKYSDCGLIIFGYDFINQNNVVKPGWHPNEEKYMLPPDSFYFMMRSVPCRWPSIVINTKKSRSIGNLDDKSGYLCTAVDSLYLQHLAIKFPIAVVPDVVGRYRVWNNNGTSQAIFTYNWFKDINLWQDKLRNILEKEDIYEVNYDRLRSRIIFDNLIAALSFAKKKKTKEKFNFVRKVGWPKGLGLLDYLRLIKGIVCN